MSTVEDLYGIPTSLPELAHLDDTVLSSSAKIAVYYTASLSRGDMTAILASINSPVFSGDPDDSDDLHAQLAPNADFTGKSLLDVVNHHTDVVLGRGSAEKSELDGYHPTYIIAVTDEDWRTNGVLLISLDTYREYGNGYVFAFPHPAVEAASVFINIEVGNTSWEEAADTIGAVIPEIPSAAATASETEKEFAALLDQWDVDEMGTIAFYSLYKQVGDGMALWDGLNGGPGYWDRSTDRWPCQPNCLQYRFPESYAPDADQDAKIAAVCAGHQKWTRKENLWFHERFIVISDHEDIETEGVLIAEVSEDGNDIRLERVALADVVGWLVANVAEIAAADLQARRLQTTEQ